MVKSKAIDLLKTFNKKEFKEFGDFVRSPFFNKNPKQLKLYEILKNYYPDFNSPQLTKESIYARLYPGKKYKDNEIRRSLSEILKLGEEYLSHSRINEKGQFVKRKALLHELGSRKLFKMFDSAMINILEKYREAKEIEDDYFMRNFDIQVIKTNYESGRVPSKESGEITIDNLLNCFRYLIAFSLITTLKLNQDFLVMHINYNFDNKNTIAYKYLERLDLTDFLEDVKKYDESLYRILKIYHTHFLIMAGFDADDAGYWTLKKLVEENLDQFSRFEKYNLLLFLESCASVKIKEGKTSFVKEIHEIHKIILERNLYESEDTNYMNLVRFWKIVNNALALKKFDWTENFIKEYSEKLNPEVVEHMKNYSYSLLSFTKGDYQKSLEYAAKVKSFEFSINFGTKALKLKCFYELGYCEEAIYSVDSYKHSLRKDAISPDWIKTRFSNFLNYFLKILMIMEKGEKSIDQGILRNEISKETEVLEKDWLLEKLKS